MTTKRFFMNWLWAGIVTIVAAALITFCVKDFLTATSPNGLRIISKVALGNGSAKFTLDLGVSVLAFTANDSYGLEAGDYIPIFDEFKQQADAAAIFALIAAIVIFIAYIIDIVRVPTLIKKYRCKRNNPFYGEIASYAHFGPGLYTAIIEADGAKYSLGIPMIKAECKKYKVGTPVTIWSGGGKTKWVEFSKEQPFLS